MFLVEYRFAPAAAEIEVGQGFARRLFIKSGKLDDFINMAKIVVEIFDR